MKRKRTPSPHLGREKNPWVTSPTTRRSTRANNPDSSAGASKILDSPERQSNGIRETRRTRNSDAFSSFQDSEDHPLSSPILSRTRARQVSSCESDVPIPTRPKNHVTFSKPAKISPKKLRSRRLAAHKAEERMRSWQNGYSDDDLHALSNKYSSRSTGRNKGNLEELEDEPAPRSSRLRIDANRRVDESEADHESCSDDEELPNGLPTKTSPGGSRLTVSDSLRRRSGRLRKKNDEESEDECSSSTTSSSGDEPNYRGGRPNRKRRPVQRLTYEPKERPHRSSRGTKRDSIRNLDQYSSDEDVINNGEVCKPRRSRYNIRKQRKRLTYVKDSSSSSSASSDGDEEKFLKRKNKRMQIERAKMRPLNMDVNDMKLSIIRDRRDAGTSCADIKPMEVDLTTSFESVGGSESHIMCLREMVVLPLLYPEIFSKFKIAPPRGVLFHGPPGTGKTLLARALAAECSNEARKVAFYMRKGADVLSKWVGESERQLRLLFEQAYLTRPSIIFFDEFDGLAPVRSSKQEQIHSTIVSTLLALIDGLDSRGEVIVIGATNRIENIDPAFRRPGRFDRELRFQLPTRDSRKEILKVHTRDWKPSVPEALIDVIADKTIGYSGADIKGLCSEAVLRALRRRYPQVYKTSQKLGIDAENVFVIESDFKVAMNDMVPSSHRVHDQIQAPLPVAIRPLLNISLENICKKVDKVFNPESSFRPRILLKGNRCQGLLTYLVPAVLHHLEKVPCHLLDRPSLVSCPASSPEERLCQIIHEARKTVPSILYVSNIQDLLLEYNLRHTFISLISNIQPTTPLLILGVIEADEDMEDDVTSQINKLFSREEETLFVQEPTKEQRQAYFQQIFDSITAMPDLSDDVQEEILEGLPIVPPPQFRELSEIEEKKLRRKEEARLRELRIFLREIWHKISKQKNFYLFKSPVDIQQCDDYFEYVTTPMDFDTIRIKLDEKKYETAQSFLDDIDLIAHNARVYNADTSIETNRVIVRQAAALQDYAYALIKAEMDTDFEDECKQIVERRKKLTDKLEDPNPTQMFFGHPKNESPKSKKKKRKSSWSRGLIPKPKRQAAVETSDEELVEEASVEMDKSEIHQKPVEVDASALKEVRKKLLSVTAPMNLEELERVFVQLNAIVQKHTKNLDRAEVLLDVQNLVKGFI